MEYPFGRGVNFQIEVKDISPTLKRLKKNRYKLKMPPKENWYGKNGKLLGVREFLVTDPDGYLLRFSQSIGTRNKPASRDGSVENPRAAAGRGALGPGPKRSAPKGGPACPGRQPQLARPLPVEHFYSTLVFINLKCRKVVLVLRYVL